MLPNTLPFLNPLIKRRKEDLTGVKPRCSMLLLSMNLATGFLFGQKMLTHPWHVLPTSVSRVCDSIYISYPLTSPFNPEKVIISGDLILQRRQAGANIKVSSNLSFLDFTY